MKYVVEYDSNNSGGNWWLTDEQWRKLESAGWIVDWRRNHTTGLGRADKDGRWLGALATSASLMVEAQDATEAEMIATHRWEKVTFSDPYAEGCHCCGRPHSFYTSEAKDA